jgi:hypothetical protein
MSEPVDTSAEAVERLAAIMADDSDSEMWDASLTVAATLRALAAERDRLREALRKNAGISNECTWTPRLRAVDGEIQDIIRTALSQPPVKEPRE